MAASAPAPLRLSKLPNQAPTPFSLEPDETARAQMAVDLGISGIRKLRFEGALHPEGTQGWRLEAELGATVVQPCGITLAPVTTRIDEPVLRRYSPEATLPTDPEAEIPEDDSLEPLPETLDLAQVMAEALALSLPAFPRAEGAELGQMIAAPPGTAPLDDDAVKPFAGLQALKDKMAGDDG